MPDQIPFVEGVGWAMMVVSVIVYFCPIPDSQTKCSVDQCGYIFRTLVFLINGWFGVAVAVVILSVKWKQYTPQDDEINGISISDPSSQTYKLYAWSFELATEIIIALMVLRLVYSFLRQFCGTCVCDGVCTCCCETGGQRTLRSLPCMDNRVIGVDQQILSALSCLVIAALLTNLLPPLSFASISMIFIGFVIGFYILSVILGEFVASILVEFEEGVLIANTIAFSFLLLYLGPSSWYGQSDPTYAGVFAGIALLAVLHVFYSQIVNCLCDKWRREMNERYGWNELPRREEGKESKA